MKKLLYLSLLFISCNVCKYQTTYAQITFTAYGGTTVGFSGTTLSKASQAYTAGRVYFAQIIANSLETPTLTATGMTWTLQDYQDYNTAGSPSYRMCIFRSAPTATTTTDVNATWTVANTVRTARFIEVTGVDAAGTNGSNSVVGLTKAAQDGGTSPTITRSGLSNVSNGILAFYGNTLNPFNGTPESGWTEVHDGGAQNTGPTITIGIYAMSIVGSTDTTPTVTTSASNWAGIAIEIKALKRRIMIVN